MSNLPLCQRLCIDDLCRGNPDNTLCGGSYCHQCHGPRWTMVRYAISAETQTMDTMTMKMVAAETPPANHKHDWEIIRGVPVCRICKQTFRQVCGE